MFKHAMAGALKCAQNLKISSLAFHGLGTRVGGLPMKTAASITMQELKKHLNQLTTLKVVIFVGYRNEAAEDFQKAFSKVFRNVGY